MVLICLEFILVAAGLFFAVSEQNVKEPFLAKSFNSFFSLNKEANLPTWFSTILLFFSSCLLGLIAALNLKDGRRFRYHWLILALIFLALSLDEAAWVHEKFTDRIREIFDLSGIFYYAWVLPAIFLVIGFGLAYLRFVLALAPRTRSLFILAAALSVGGGLILEMGGGWIESSYGAESLLFRLETVAEEALEMVGMTVFIYALLDHIRHKRLTLGVVE
ncbi:MAG: hypothetical protein JRJ59_03240 [Deltaproteobacteria bacterium]|nr:hypothetical protein [Deltaproteobacteria bacterium]